MNHHRYVDLSTPRTHVALLATCVAVLVAAAPAASTRPATAPSKVDHYRASFAEFLESAAAQRSIDLEALDHPLIAAAIFHETNRHRAEHNLPALKHAPKLDASSQMHVKDMVAGDFFAHENELDKTKHHPIDRVQLVGYKPRFVAENIATAFAIRYDAGRPYYQVPGGVSYSPDGKPIEPHSYASFAKDLVQRWMDSPGHRANILSKEPTQLGNAVAVQPAKGEELAKVYAGQNFGDPMRR